LGSSGVQTFNARLMLVEEALERSNDNSVK